ncbi:hypothetical protein M378DRAFT_174313 [Amanita muscaria Koide BX008]|uniref:Uncharacterized protein n=1 Tax=Amanita muscaria (strain Koide BX008) TaxID=946122 RepID=A0A0C2VZN0_AMAMK|nr:hypothetical protein M378DRAFT_174322 [Amanita muscaria Koide BX008]KIL54307.1 hypothetical protein M378DRAFT_174313 [Amanita muscaria Koide BX008]
MVKHGQLPHIGLLNPVGTAASTDERLPHQSVRFHQEDLSRAASDLVIPRLATTPESSIEQDRNAW